MQGAFFFFFSCKSVFCKQIVSRSCEKLLRLQWSLSCKRQCNSTTTTPSMFRFLLLLYRIIWQTFILRKTRLLEDLVASGLKTFILYQLNMSNFLPLLLELIILLLSVWNANKLISSWQYISHFSNKSFFLLISEINQDT